MRLKILAPHQTIDGVPVEPGDFVEVASRALARQLVNSGYAVHAETTMPTERGSHYADSTTEAWEATE